MTRGSVPRSATRLCAALLTCAVIGGCVALAPPPADPAAAEARFAEAEQAIRSGDRELATTLLHAAEAADPTNPRTYLRLGLLLELAADPAGADAAYRRGLARTTDTPERHELAYRGALVAAFKLADRERPREVLKTLPEDDPRRDDLAAVVALGDGDGRAALALLNQARKHPLTAEQGAQLNYHAALAYLLLGESELSLTALYNAVNLADRHPIVREIEQLREQIKSR